MVLVDRFSSDKEDGLIHHVRVGQADFDGMVIVVDGHDGNRFVHERNVAALVQGGLEREPTRLGFILETNVLPGNGELSFVVEESNVRVEGHAGVEVGHQGRNVLGGSEPGMRLFARVQESARGDRYVVNRVAVEREIEREGMGHCSTMSIRQNIVHLTIRIVQFNPQRLRSRFLPGHAALIVMVRIVCRRRNIMLVQHFVRNVGREVVQVVTRSVRRVRSD
uniref:Uncharacterized protein n=1 Tax=Cacopsylla melanoneura TaxID=428564 RepID=A0A8D8LFT1_9HEMI